MMKTKGSTMASISPTKESLAGAAGVAGAALAHPGQQAMASRPDARHSAEERDGQAARVMASWRVRTGAVPAYVISAVRTAAAA